MRTKYRFTLDTQLFGGRGANASSAGPSGSRSIVSALGGKSGVSDAVLDEINNRMGRQYKREYAEGLAKNGAQDIHFSDMVTYIARNNDIPLPEPENRPYRDVIKDAIGGRAFQQLDSGLRGGAQRWLDENPRRRRRG